MKKKIKYTSEPMGSLKVIKDFLPGPKDLIFKEDTAKVTIALSKSSVKIFKKMAKEQHTQYQKMIRRVIDLYAQHYQ
jgi:predicted DNA binding CopG/RHH family protein